MGPPGALCPLPPPSTLFSKGRPWRKEALIQEWQEWHEWQAEGRLTPGAGADITESTMRKARCAIMSSKAIKGLAKVVDDKINGA
jgi:hypothetical protein